MTNPVERIAVTLESGDMLYLCHLKREFKKDSVLKKIKEKGQYIYKDRKNTYHIPELTTQLIASNTRGVLLATQLCPYCKSNIIMTIRCIVNEEITHCCNCNRDMYKRRK
jgi:hypothetical protein